MNWMGIWFGAVVGLCSFGANICERILQCRDSIFRQNVSSYLHCILIHPDVYSRGAVGYTTGVT